MAAGVTFGPLTAVAIWEELGDTRRFSSSRAAERPRRAALDAVRGQPCAPATPPPPDHAYYVQVKQRLGPRSAAGATRGPRRPAPANSSNAERTKRSAH